MPGSVMKEDSALFGDIERSLNMSEKNSGNKHSEDIEFNATLGWLAALAVTIAAWAGLAS
jgi:hypothetical protein